MDTYLAVVQTLTVLAAFFGLWVALRIAKQDRREAARIAEADRAAMRHEAERRHTLDLLIRLSANLEQGGSIDRQERARMAGEAAAIITALGPERLPRQFSERGSFEDARKRLEDPATDLDWRSRADEVAVALDRIARDRSAS